MQDDEDDGQATKKRTKKQVSSECTSKRDSFSDLMEEKDMNDLTEYDKNENIVPFLSNERTNKKYNVDEDDEDLRKSEHL